MKKFLIILFSLILLPFVYADCVPGSVSTTFVAGQQPSNQVISCTNNLNSSITLTKIGPYFSISSDTIGSLEQKSITITFDSSAPEGNYYNLIQFSDGSTVPVNIFVKDQQQVGECVIDIFPTTLSNIKISQGTTKNREILVTVPQCYPSKVSFRAVSLESNEQPIELGELALGDLSPGNSVRIPLVFDATNCQTGTYYESLSFNLANASGIRIPVSSVSISATVTSGITPITNETFSTLPICSFSTIDMRLNNTEQLICNGMHPNIKVEVIGNEYIKGISVEETAGQWVWKFQPTKTGDTTIEYYFAYKGAQIGELNQQDVRITTGGGLPASANMKIRFYPPLEEVIEGNNVTFIIQDDGNNNTIEDAKCYLNGKELEKREITIKNGDSLLISHPNYNSLEITINLPEKRLEIITAPEMLKTGDNIVISVRDNTTKEGISNVSITFDGGPVSNSFQLKVFGEHKIGASSSGYINAEKTINITKAVYILTTSPEELKKGDEVIITLSEPVLWEVRYMKNIESEEETIAKSENAEDKATFKIKKDGNYYLYGNNELIRNFPIGAGEQGKSIWFWIILGLTLGIVLLAIIAIVKSEKFKKKKSFEEIVSQSPIVIDGGKR